MAAPDHNVLIVAVTGLDRAVLPLCRRVFCNISAVLLNGSADLEEMNPRLDDLGETWRRIRPHAGFILPDVAMTPQFHAKCPKTAQGGRFR